MGLAGVAHFGLLRRTPTVIFPGTPADGRANSQLNELACRQVVAGALPDVHASTATTTARATTRSVDQLLVRSQLGLMDLFAMDLQYCVLYEVLRKYNNPNMWTCGPACCGRAIIWELVRRLRLELLRIATVPWFG